ncbi:MAG: amidohydrolase family protein [Christensenellaceae bacterium]|nr:amidohydrolase family protein [Christensenellaceae bacterium]
MLNPEAEILDILIKDGFIVDISKNIDANDCEVIDCTNKIVLPGLIDSHCHIGVFGTAMGEIGVDGNESTNTCTASSRAIDGINFLDKEFEHAYKHGVTCVSTGPGSANPIAGQFVTMYTHGSGFKDMIIKEPASLKLAFGENPKTSHKNTGPITRMGVSSVIRQKFYEAQKYDPNKEVNLDLDILKQCLDGKLPVKAHAHRADDILTALRIAEEFNLDMSIEHCTEGYRIIEELKKANGVIIGPMIDFPHKLELKNRTLENANLLFKNGIKFAIMSDLPGMHCGDIVLEAGLCIREGLPIIEALKAITINAAEILKIDNETGSIEKGKNADITIFDKNPVVDITAKCLLTMIKGKIIYKNF